MKTRFLIVAVLVSLVLVGCVPAQIASPSAVGQEPEVAEEPAEESLEVAAPTMTEEEALAFVREHFPAERYMTNAYLPTEDQELTPMECDSYEPIKVGMPWIFNDEPAPWYNAIEKGYYEAVCLEVELVAGGPGIDHVKTLAGGAVDIAVSAGGAPIPLMVSSRTGADVVAIGTFLKDTPYVWLGIDWDTPQDQRSTKTLTPQDLVDMTVGIQADALYYADIIERKNDLPPGSIRVVKGGFSPDPLIMKQWDLYAAWVVNQPRTLEDQGYHNWYIFEYGDYGFNSYGDVSVTTQQALSERPDMVRRYLLATREGIRFLLDNPEESAEIASRYAKELGDVELTPEMALRRFELQEELIVGDGSSPLMFMDPEVWNLQVAILYQYGQLEIVPGQ